MSLTKTCNPRSPPASLYFFSLPFFLRVTFLTEIPKDLSRLYFMWLCTCHSLSLGGLSITAHWAVENKAIKADKLERLLMPRKQTNKYIYIYTLLLYVRIFIQLLRISPLSLLSLCWFDFCFVEIAVKTKTVSKRNACPSSPRTPHLAFARLWEGDNQQGRLQKQAYLIS